MDQTHAETLAVLDAKAATRTSPWPTWPSYDDDTGAALLEVMASQRWALSGASRGKPCFERLFADAFATYHDVGFCTPVSNGSAALNIALRALGVGYGDKVVVPGLTWIACATAVMSVGALPIPADIDLETLAMSPRALEDRLHQGGVRAVIVVHPFCTVADIQQTVALCQRFGIPLIEDCSQAHGAEWLGRKVGAFGEIGVFSMQQSKVLTAGEGGALITRSADLAQTIEQLRADGRIFASKADVGRLELLEIGSVQGRNHCLSEFQAAVLLDRLAHLDDENARRRRNAALLDEYMAQVPGAKPISQSRDITPTYYNYPISLDRTVFAGKSIVDIANALSAELNVQVSPIYRPMHRHRLFRYDAEPILRNLREEYASLAQSFEADLPNCIAAHESFITLPHPVLLGDANDMRLIKNALAKVSRLAHAIPSASNPLAGF